VKVTIRKGPPTTEIPDGPVVVEVWMSPAEAKAHAHRSPALEEAIEAILPEHLRTRYRVSKQVHSGRHPA
jgi:hypothetical protein